MDFLTTPYLWELYETPLPALSLGRAGVKGWLSGSRALVGLGGAIALTLISPNLLADSYYPRSGTAYIAPPPGFNVNIRSGPGTQYPAVNTLRAGTAIAITGQYQGGWAQLTDGSWVAGNLIRGDGVDLGQGGAAIAYINSSSGFNVNIRSGPGTQYPAVNTLAQGTAITLNGRYQNGWAQLADGTWVAAHLIRVGSAITPPRPNPQPQPETFLQVGSRNPLVIDVEGRLRDLGYVTANFPADDYYGNDTAQAVQNFQRRNRLPVDGIAGPATRDRLFSATAIDNFPDSGSPNNPDPGDPPDQGNGRQVRVRTTDGQEAIVFAGPGTEYDLLGFITDGTIVTITGRTDGNWSELDNGNWIYTDFLDL